MLQSSRHFLRHRLSAVLVACTIGLPGWSLALDPNLSLYQYNCTTWRQANGLPANSVNAIAQSVDDRIWLATPKGLISFDGLEFRVANAEALGPIKGKVLTSLARRSAGGLWVGSEHGGFGYFNGQEFVSLSHLANDDLAGLTHVVREDDGTLLVGTQSKAIRLIGTNRPVMLLPSVAYPDAFCVSKDRLGRIWIGTAQHGLWYWQDGKSTEFPDTALRGTIIVAVVTDFEGRVWVSTSSLGLRCYDEQFKLQPLNTGLGDPRELLLDQHGVLWIGSVTHGLFRCYAGKFTNLKKQDGLAHDRVLSLAESQDGSIWIGTADGLTQLSDVKLPILSVTEGLASDGCLAVAASPQGGIWAGTPGGASWYRNGVFTNFEAPGPANFHSTWLKRVYAARNGDVYFIGAKRNLDRLRNGRVDKTWTNGLWPCDVAEDSKSILVGMQRNLMRIENDELVPCHLADGTSVSPNWINSLFVSRDDAIWIGTPNGAYEIRNGTLRDWGKQFGIAQGNFIGFAEDSNGAVWGLQSQGLVRFKNGRASIVSAQNGLHEQLVYAMVDDLKGNFWMDSNRGIFYVSQEELNAVADGALGSVHCTVYEGQDAIKTTDKLGMDYSGCRSLEGRIYFPSSRGIVVVDPGRIQTNREPPPVCIQRVRINGEECRIEQGLVLETKHRDLEFSYSALDYRAPHKIQFRYRLEGYDPGWIEAGKRRSAFYTNLKPGEYRFRVQACNADGVWNLVGAASKVRLLPHFYETLLFRLGCAIAMLAGVFSLFSWRVRFLRRREKELQEANVLMETRVRERTAELAEANSSLRREIEERRRAQAETERLQSTLVEASRKAGQAEVASNVLHNVGNVLNSLNVSASIVSEHLRQLPVGHLAKAVEMLNVHAEDLGRFMTADEKGRKLPLFLNRLSNHLAREQSDLKSEMDEMTANLDHIKQIVAAQQSYSRVAGVLEKTSVSELVEGALKIHSASFQKRSIEVVREYEPVEPIMVDRHKVLQIMLNLFQNAARACEDTGDTPRKVITSIRAIGAQRVAVEVMDNGVGIPPENLTRIFCHGFTTHKSGHGFGLHGSALAAREMGGTLSARSDGPGCGATFSLELPVVPDSSAS